MDDGQQVKKGGVTLCTDSFNSYEVNILREALKTKFQLKTSIHEKKVKTMFYMKESIFEKIHFKS